MADGWLWLGESWAPLPGAGPSRRTDAAMANDPGRPESSPLLFGGRSHSGEGGCGEGQTTSCDDTWILSGATWEQLSPPTIPPRRDLHALAPTAAGAESRVLLFGGSSTTQDIFRTVSRSALGDTWEWDGDDWHERVVDPAPPARWGHGLAFDRGRGRTVLFGGDGADPRSCGSAREVCRDPWEWSDGRWSQRSPLVRPSARSRFGMAYHDASGAIVLTGGRAEGEGLGAACGGAQSWCGDTWTYAPARTVPHLVAAFDLAGAGLVGRTSADPEEKVVKSVSFGVSARGLGHTGGTGDADADPLEGYVLLVGAFGDGGWLPLHRSEGAPDGLDLWRGTWDRSWSCGEAWCASATLDRWLGDDGVLHLAVAPLPPSGAAPVDGAAAVDYLEARVAVWRTGCRQPGGQDAAGTPDGTLCDDGDPTTRGETCRGFVCRPRR